jgi:hypothetical protein
MAMVQKFRGHEATAELENPQRDVPITNVRDLPAVEFIKDKDEVAAIGLALRTDAVVIATVIGAKFVEALADDYAHLESRHGHLCPAWDLTIHAVVVAKVRLDDDLEVDGFFLLDPWYPNTEQPLEIELDDFHSFFAGHAYVCRREVA